MTVAALPATIAYVEDGATTVFPVPFRFKAPGDLIVERIVNAVPVALTLGVDYTVTGGATDAGGTLTRTAVTTGATLRIRRRTARQQPMVYTSGDRFPAKSHEEALDRSILIDQEQDVAIADTATRALMVPIGEVSPATVPKAAVRAGRLAIWGITGALLASSVTAAQLEAAIAAPYAPQFAQFADNVLYQPAAGAPQRSLAAKAAETVSVKDWGAIGDGTLHTVAEWIVPGALGRFVSLAALQAVYPHVAATTDSIDWAACQQTFDQASLPARRKACFVPSGDYRLSASLSIVKPIQVEGEGPDQSVFSVATNIDVFDCAMTSASDRGLRIAHIGVRQTLPHMVVAAGAGMKLTLAYVARIENVRIAGCWNGFDVVQSPLTNVTNFYIEGFKNYAIWVHGGNSYDMYWSLFFISGNNGLDAKGFVGVRLDDMNDEFLFTNGIVSTCVNALIGDATVLIISQNPEFCRVSHVSFDNCENGPDLNHCIDWIFDGCFFSNRPGFGWRIGQTKPARGIKVIHSTILNCGGNGGEVGPFAIDTLIQGNSFIGNSTETPSQAHGMVIASGATNTVVLANVFGNDWPGTFGFQNYGIFMPGPTNNGLVVDHNTFKPVGGTFVNASTGTDQKIGDTNIGLRTRASGTVTLAAGVKAVAITPGFPSANYKVFFDPGVNETLWATDRDASGFTARSSNASSSITAGWTAFL